MEINPGDGEVELITKFAVIEASNSGSNEVVAGVSDHKIRVLAYTLICAAAVTVTWKSAANSISGVMSYAANGGAAPSPLPLGLIETTTGAALNISLSSNLQVGGHLTYVEIK